MAQIQTQKPSPKTPAKTRTVAKGTNAPAPVQAAPAHEAVRFYGLEGFRPSAGTALFTYTLAWLTATGLIDGGRAPAHKIRALAGSATRRQHAARILEEGTEAYLAPGAADFFKGVTDPKRRGINPRHVDAWVEMLKTGKPDGEMMKNPTGLKAF